jgi:hypothetical protein
MLFNSTGNFTVEHGFEVSSFLRAASFNIQRSTLNS